MQSTIPDRPTKVLQGGRANFPTVLRVANRPSRPEDRIDPSCHTTAHPATSLPVRSKKEDLLRSFPGSETSPYLQPSTSRAQNQLSNDGSMLNISANH